MKECSEQLGAPVYFTNYTMLLSRADDAYVDKWRRMNKWTIDQVPFTGEAYRQLANDLIKGNKLVKGELMVGNKKVDLRILRPIYLLYRVQEII